MKYNLIMYKHLSNRAYKYKFATSKKMGFLKRVNPKNTSSHYMVIVKISIFYR